MNSENAANSDVRVDIADQPPRANYLAWLGPIVVLAGSMSYFLFFVYIPGLRDFPWVNLPFVILGMALSSVGLARALFARRRKFVAKLIASFGFLFSLAVGGLFCAHIFVLSFQIPGADSAPQVGAPAPGFSLMDQNGEKVELADFQGKKIVVTFYRGWW